MSIWSLFRAKPPELSLEERRLAEIKTLLEGHVAKIKSHHPTATLLEKLQDANAEPAENPLESLKILIQFASVLKEAQSLPQMSEETVRLKAKAQEWNATSEQLEVEVARLDGVILKMRELLRRKQDNLQRMKQIVAAQSKV